MTPTAEFRRQEAPREAGSAFAPDEILASLERIEASEGFAGSAQLCRFLRYVVEQSLRDDGGALKESSIGVEVFNRGGGYDPKTDPIVRVEARRLRTRLAAYYETSGASDRIRILLPKGGYAPAFERVNFAVEPEPMVPPAAPEVTVDPKPVGRRWAVIAGTAVALVSTALLIVRTSASERLASQFWRTMLEGERPALLIPADSGLVMYQDLTHRAVALPEYLSGEYRTREAGAVADSVAITSLASRRYTSIADLTFTSRLAGRPEASRRGVGVRYARDVRMEDLKGGSVILLGARHSNPWVELYEKDATLRLEHDEKSRTFRLLNLAPGRGEAAEIVLTPEELKKELWAIITWHRNREGSGWALVVAGTSVAGTEAAANFLLDPAKLEPWLKRASSGGSIQGFDVLLHDRNLAGVAPQAEVVAFHREGR